MSFSYRSGSLVFVTAAVVAGCSTDSKEPLRPGVDDSSQTYQGTPDADETAFWTALRDGDDTGRASAVSKMVADVAKDPGNGYSEFLIGASNFMPPTSVLAALAGGTMPSQFQVDGSAAMPYLMEAPNHLSDPFYLGFDEGLAADLELQAGNTAMGGPLFGEAVGYNHAATGYMSILNDLFQNNPSQALTDAYGLFDFCNGSAVDQGGADAMAYAGKMNAGTLVHRECYSGYFAPHGSPGELLIMAEVEALNGDTAASTAYFAALQTATDYPTWPLKPYVERRLAGEPVNGQLVAGIAATCGTCHTDALP
jgi:hypothetical protein